MTAELVMPGPAIARDRWDRPLIKQADGGTEAYTRATTVAGTTEKGYALTEWLERMVAVGIATREDLRLRVISLGPPPDKGSELAKGWKDSMDELVKAALEAAKSKAKATTGSAWHAICEASDYGHEVEGLPLELAPVLAAYVEATSSLEAVHIEQLMVHDELKIAGTPDRVVKIAGMPGLYIADIKTGAVESYTVGKMAIQLALYSRMVGYDVRTGDRFTVPEISPTNGVIIALDPILATCRLHWINLTRGWEGAELAIKVREWQSSTAGLTVPWGN